MVAPPARNDSKDPIPLPSGLPKMDGSLPPLPGLGNKPGFKLPTDRETDDWIANVDKITKQIQGICSGEVSLEEIDETDRLLQIQKRAKEIADQEREELQRKFRVMGRSGKGEKEDYLLFCKKCHREYLFEVEECGICKGKLMTQKERRAELLVKVEVLKEEQGKHKKRKDHWLRWRKTQQMLGKSRWIKYHAWQFWEPETDEEDEPEPIVPKHDPNFQAMEKDLQERIRKRKEKYLIAMKYKDQGNAKLKAGDFAGAVEDYAEGLENRKDLKVLWSNKALAELKCYRYRDAVSSTSKVLEMSEIFDDGFEKDRDLNIKAFLRQAEGYRGLQEWKQAIEPLEQAVKLGSTKEAGDLLKRTQAAAKEQEKADALLQKKTQPKAQTSGTKKIEIIEEDDERIGDLTEEQFQILVKSLLNEEQRVLFCTRVDGRSKFDDLLADLEKINMYWRKATGKLQKKIDPKFKDQYKEEEDPEKSVEVLERKALRCIVILRLLVRSYDLATELSLPAVRYLFSFMHSEKLCTDLLCIINDLSFEDATRTHCANVLGRNEDHVTRLIHLATVDTQEHFTPPSRSVEDKELTYRPPAVESALIILGNFANKSKIKTMLAPHAEVLMSMIERRLIPNDIFLGERVGSLLTNLMSSEESGQIFTDILVNKMIPKVINVIRKDNKEVPGHEGRVTRYLGVLLNAVACSRSAQQQFQDLKQINVFVELVEKEKDDDIRARALSIIAKTITGSPEMEKVEPQLITLIKSYIDNIKEPVGPMEETIVRLLTTLIVKGTTITRWKKDDCGKSEAKEITQKIINLSKRMKPKSYQGPTDHSIRSTVLGNLALIVSELAPWDGVDLLDCVETFIEGLRKERGGVQHNCGVSVTKLAMQDRYKSLVRELNGFESLHQIQLKNQEAANTTRRPGRRAIA